MHVSEVSRAFFATSKETVDLLAQAFSWIHAVEIVTDKKLRDTLSGIGVDAIDVATLPNFAEIALSIDFIVVDLDDPEIMLDPHVLTLLKMADTAPERIVIICDHTDYQIVISEMNHLGGSLSDETRRMLAAKAHQHEALCENPALKSLRT
jgi:AICAR transformylase/IMP cyclohydrolase PurH